MFNIRIYGLLIDNNKVLVTDEIRFGRKITKFPGGGLEFGEGLRDALIREWKEEVNQDIEVIDHFYTTDFFQQSAFDDKQVISIYYYVKELSPLNVPVTNNPFEFLEDKEDAQVFRWIDLTQINETDFTFPIDKKVGEMLRIKS